MLFLGPALLEEDSKARPKIFISAGMCPFVPGTRIPSPLLVLLSLFSFPDCSHGPSTGLVNDRKDSFLGRSHE
jgi:hypothetical protein